MVFGALPGGSRWSGSLPGSVSPPRQPHLPRRVLQLMPPKSKSGTSGQGGSRGGRRRAIPRRTMARRPTLTRAGPRALQPHRTEWAPRVKRSKLSRVPLVRSPPRSSSDSEGGVCRSPVAEPGVPASPASEDGVVTPGRADLAASLLPHDMAGSPSADRAVPVGLLAKAADATLPGSDVVHSKRLTPQRRVNSIEDVLSMDITDIGTAFPVCAAGDELRRQALMHGTRCVLRRVVPCAAHARLRHGLCLTPPPLSCVRASRHGVHQGPGDAGAGRRRAQGASLVACSCRLRAARPVLRRLVTAVRAGPAALVQAGAKPRGQRRQCRGRWWCEEHLTAAQEWRVSDGVAPSPRFLVDSAQVQAAPVPPRQPSAPRHCADSLRCTRCREPPRGICA